MPEDDKKEKITDRIEREKEEDQKDRAKKQSSCALLLGVISNWVCVDYLMKIKGAPDPSLIQEIIRPFVIMTPLGGIVSGIKGLYGNGLGKDWLEWASLAILGMFFCGLALFNMATLPDDRNDPPRANEIQNEIQDKRSKEFEGRLKDLRTSDVPVSKEF